MPFRECAQSPWVLIVKSGDFLGESEDRRRFDKTSPRAEVKYEQAKCLISVTLSVCGEVAEWPKAAVC